MPKKKVSPPATKHNLQQFMERMTKQMTTWQQENRRDIEHWKDEIILHFDTVAENLIHDFRGALTDKISRHEDRIIRLEHHAGIRA